MSSSTDFPQLLMAGGAAMLVALTLVFAVSSIGLVFAFWGKWKPLIASLGSMAVVTGVAAVAVVFLVETRQGSGIPDWIEAAVFVGFGLAAMLAAACLFIGLFALVHHKRWGVLIGLGAVPLIGLLGLFALFVPYASSERDVTEQGVSMAVSMPTGRGTSGDVAGWVDQVNGKPRITIGDLAGEPPEPPVPAMNEQADTTPTPQNEFDAEESAPTSGDDRPGWMDGDLAANQKVFASGPFTSKRSCWDDTAEQVAEQMREQFNDTYPELATAGIPFQVDLGRVVKARHTEQRETSVGQMHLLYTLVETDDLQRQIFAAVAEETRRGRGLTRVAIGGGLLLGLIGVTHGILRSGLRQHEASPKQVNSEP